MERVCTFVGEWGIQSGKGIQICGGMGGSKLESVGTDMGEWKGYVHLCENESIQEVKGTHILGGMVRYKFKRVYTNVSVWQG